MNSTRNEAGSRLKTCITEQLKKLTYRIYERAFFSLKINVNRRYISDLPIFKVIEREKENNWFMLPWNFDKDLPSRCEHHKIQRLQSSTAEKKNNYITRRTYLEKLSSHVTFY